MLLLYLHVFMYKYSRFRISSEFARNVKSQQKRILAIEKRGLVVDAVVVNNKMME